MFFTPWVSSPDTQVFYGWQMIVLNSLLMLINLIMIFNDFLGNFKLLIIKYYNKTKAKMTLIKQKFI